MPPATPQQQPSAEEYIENRLSKKLGKAQALNEQLVAERDNLKKELDRITLENADLRTKADTSVAAKRVAELEQRLVAIDHRKIVDRVAAVKGANPAALDDLWVLLERDGYKATGEPDEAAIGALLDEQKGKRAFLFSQPNGQQGPPPPKPGAASGQGGRETGAPTMISEDDPRWNDAKWQFQNFDRLAEEANANLAKGRF